MNRKTSAGRAPVILIAVIALAAVGFAIWWFMGGASAGSAKFADSWVPKGTKAAVIVDMQDLRDSPLYEEYMKPAMIPMVELMKQEGMDFDLMDIFEKIDKCALVVMEYPGAFGDPGDVAFVVTGDIDAKALVARIGEALGGAEKATVAGLEGLVMAKETQGIALTYDAKTLMVGTKGTLEKMIALQRGEGGEPASADSGWSDIQGKIDTASSYWGVGIMPSGVGGMMPPPFESFASLDYFAFSVDADSGVEMLGAMHFGSSDDAEAVAKQLSGFVAMGKSMIGGLAPSMADITKEVLDDVDIDSSGSYATMEIAIDKDTYVRLAEASEKMMSEMGLDALGRPKAPF